MSARHWWAKLATAAWMALLTKTTSAWTVSMFKPKAMRRANTVGSGAIRDFFGSLDRFKATKGLFATASTFSPSARQTAEQLSKRIVLIDGDQLTHLMIRHGVACRIEETLHIKKVDEEFFV
jgi:restriction system protein